MEAFLVSTGIVALGEMGDKTQLLALLLAARFRKPVPIVLGILVATLANHAMAGALGGLLAAWMGPQWLRWVIGISFLAMAVWMLVPDKLDDVETEGRGRKLGVFGTTVLAFFLAEMGDKTQIARRVSMRLVHGIAAAIFAVLGVLTLLNVGQLF
jgi:putative Ca2+/H+ antiporter (TMEM165/GDT1 family)